MQYFKFQLFIGLLLLVPALVLAHGDGGAMSGWGAGFAHPWHGADHVLAMLAVGLWAAQLGGRAVWALPLTFITLMLAGGVLAWWGLELPYVEVGIVTSVLVLGLVLVAALRLPLSLSLGLVALFALFHGHAHGTELPLAVGAFSYSLGFVGATALLHGLGLGLGLAVQQGTLGVLTRWAGGLITLGGLYLVWA